VGTQRARRTIHRRRAQLTCALRNGDDLCDGHVGSGERASHRTGRDWSGGGGKSLTFAAAGRYRSNSALGEGRAAVSGGRITLTPDGQEPVVTTWSISGGKLYLGTTVYLRDDAGSGSLTLLGLWIEANGYAQFRFAADGTYDFSDPARGRTSRGTYTADGHTLAIRPQGRPASSFGLTYDGTSLTFINPDGTSAGEYVRAG
jgi:hypothetical protein